jgi:hypothetical protein
LACLTELAGSPLTNSGFASQTPNRQTEEKAIIFFPLIVFTCCITQIHINPEIVGLFLALDSILNNGTNLSPTGSAAIATDEGVRLHTLVGYMTAGGAN